MMILLIVLACSRPDPAEDAPRCGTPAEVCADIARGDWEISLPVTDTIERTGWEPGCIASEDEGSHYGDPDYESHPRPGYWFDYRLGGDDAVTRVPDCAFVTRTRFPYYLSLGEDTEVSGLAVAWELSTDTTKEKVEELVIAVESSWHFREGVGETGGDDYLYDWYTSEDDQGLVRWTFCRVYTERFAAYSNLACHSYVYESERQLLAAEVTTGEPLDCTVQ